MSEVSDSEQLHVVDIEVARFAVGIEDGEKESDIGIVAITRTPDAAQIDVDLLPSGFRFAEEGHGRHDFVRAAVIDGIVQSDTEIEIAPIV